MRWGHGKKGFGYDDGTNPLPGHLRGRRPSAGCRGRWCCNMLRELAEIFGITQYSSCNFHFFLQEAREARSDEPYFLRFPRKKASSYRIAYEGRVP